MFFYLWSNREGEKTRTWGNGKKGKGGRELLSQKGEGNRFIWRCREKSRNATVGGGKEPLFPVKKKSNIGQSGKIRVAGKGEKKGTRKGILS